MRHNVPFKLACLAAVLTVLIGCEQENQSMLPAKQEKESNFFIYDGYSFDIRSAVSYQTGDNLLEFWLSPTEGLTTIKEVESAGDYVVINTHKSYNGTRDRFSGTASDNSSIRFCDMAYKKGDTGSGYIDVNMTDATLTLDFVAEKLYTKSSAAPSVMLTGKYSGSYAVEQELPYSNEWGIGRERTELTDAVLTIREDGTKTDITLYTALGKAVNLQFSPERMNKKIILPDTKIGDILLLYGNDKVFDLKNASGHILTETGTDGITVEIEVNREDSRLRACYKGTYTTETVKMNRYIYDYEGESSVEGWHDIVKLMVNKSGNFTTFYFSPEAGFSISGANYTHMPILKVPESFINGGRMYVYDLSGWSLNYDLLQAEMYESDEKPHPELNDWIEISRDGDEYEIEMIITCKSSFMPTSSIDIYYKGTASK